ncbi:ras GEF [Coprinopsis marcescibilis]|uniref:Ras GEF n=1 Tax=Coprinopsis marcescibilis TaxID=230819 RepID=A0A5C3L2H9_COPMA|nr:ras GEF [Coprinopsis marcescibilis]
MSLKDLLSLAPVPALDVLVTVLSSQQQCGDLSARCVKLVLALREGMHDQHPNDFASELEDLLLSIDSKVKEWALLPPLKAFLQQTEIKEAIDRFQREIDGAMMKYSIQASLEFRKGFNDSLAAQERDRVEIRGLLETIVQNHAQMQNLLSMTSPHPVEEVMEQLQTELMDRTIPVQQKESFREGLWFLHSRTSKLPPLTDLTGQVTKESEHAVFIGTYNDVFKGRWLGKEKHFKREVSIWRKFDHPNILPLFGIAYVGDHVFSVSPWMEGGTAINYVQENPACNRLKLLSEIVIGLEYLHSQDIVHGDLRGANVLISANGVARLSDFGLSKFLEDCGRGMTSSPNINPRWFAPELIRQTGTVSKKSDIWSTAMTFLELLTGEQPFAGVPRDINVMRELDKGETPKRPLGTVYLNNGLNDPMWSLIKRCWKKPESRPTIQDIRIQLDEIRGGPSPKSGSFKGSTSTTGGTRKAFSIFSVKTTRSSERPSTSGSSNSGSSATARPKVTIPIANKGKIDEDDVISPLNGFSSSPPSARYSPQSPGRLPNRGDTIRRNSNGNGFLEPSSAIRPSPSPSSSFNNIDSSLRIEYPSAPRLEISHLSSSPPSMRNGMPPTLPKTGRTLSVDTAAIRPALSVFSTESGIHMAGPLREAILNPDLIVYTNTRGMVMAGTLEGLIERLINNFNLRKDLEYRDVMLTACIDFITPEDLFAILTRRFDEEEKASTVSSQSRRPEDRVGLQYTIFMVIIHWLSSRHLPVNDELLWQMRTFVEAAVRLKTSSTMVDKANDLLQLIQERVSLSKTEEERQAEELESTSFMSPERRMMEMKAMTNPRDLAIGLTLLEGDKYRKIMPCDYLAYQLRQPISGYQNHIDIACTVNNKLIHWIKHSVLVSDDVKFRMGVIKFYIHTALECRKLRNYSSLVAIAIALNSTPVERLALTKDLLPAKMTEALANIVSVIQPHGNHSAYRQELETVVDPEYSEYCIPWLAVHLKQLHTVLVENPRVVEVERRHLINFQRYVKFVDQFNDVLAFKPPDLEQYRDQGQLAYLEHQLANVTVSDSADDELMARSIALEAGETQLVRQRVLEKQTLGMGTPKKFRTTR